MPTQWVDTPKQVGCAPGIGGSLSKWEGCVRGNKEVVRRVLSGESDGAAKSYVRQVADIRSGEGG